jgi:hypothetical protein
MEMVCEDCGMCKTHGNLNEIKKGAKDSNGFTKCWSGYHAAGTKKSSTTGKQVRNCVPNESVEEDWQKTNKQDKTDGMSGKAVKAYRRENPGSKLKTAVTTKPSKLKPGSKAAKRRKSFCARMSGNKGPMKKPNGKPTPKALALRRWNCESVEQMAQLIERAESYIAEQKRLLEAATSGGTSSGSVATNASAAGSKNAGWLFGGSYGAPKESQGKKQKSKIIKRSA